MRLPEVALPVTLEATWDVAAAACGADVVVMGVPSHGFRAVLTDLLPSLAPGVPIVSLSKGMEVDTQLRRMNDLVGYQLSRAASSGHTLLAAPIAIETRAEQTGSGLEELYAGNGVSGEVDSKTGAG